MMHEYIKIDKIKNVWEVNPVTGDYSYDEDGRHYLCIDGVFSRKKTVLLTLFLWGIVSMRDMVVEL